MKTPWLPSDVYFGEPGKPLPDWRKTDSKEAADDDAPPSEEDREALTAVLGFDPAELWDDDPEKEAESTSVSALTAQPEREEAEAFYEEFAAASANRKVGEKWQGPSGKWFTKRQDGRVVPTANPNKQTTAKPAAAPKPTKPTAAQKQQAAATKKAAAAKAKQDAAAAKAKEQEDAARHYAGIRDNALAAAKEIAGGKAATPEHLAALGMAVLTLNLKDLQALKKAVGAAGNASRKSGAVDAIKAAAQKAAAAQPKPEPEQPAAKEAPKEPAAQKPVTAEALAPSIADKLKAWDEQYRADMPTYSLYHQLKAAHPDLTPEDYRKAIIDLHKRGLVRLSPYTGRLDAADSLANKDHALMVTQAELNGQPRGNVDSSDTVYGYVRGDNADYAGLRKLAPQPKPEPEQPAAKEQPKEAPAAPKPAAPAPEHLHSAAQAVASLAQKAGASGVARMQDIRPALAQAGLTDRAQQDAALKALWRAGAITGQGFEGRVGSPQERAEAGAAAMPDPGGGHPIGQFALRPGWEQALAKVAGQPAEASKPATKAPEKPPVAPKPAASKAAPFQPHQAGDVAQAITHAGLIRGLPGSSVGVGGGDGLAPVDVIHKQLAKRGINLNAGQMRSLVNHLWDSGAVEMHLVNAQGELSPEARAMGTPKDPADPDSSVLTLMQVKDPGKLKAALEAAAIGQSAKPAEAPKPAASKAAQEHGAKLRALLAKTQDNANHGRLGGEIAAALKDASALSPEDLHAAALEMGARPTGRSKTAFLAAIRAKLEEADAVRTGSDV